MVTAGGGAADDDGIVSGTFGRHLSASCPPAATSFSTATTPVLLHGADQAVGGPAVLIKNAEGPRVQEAEKGQQCHLRCESLSVNAVFMFIV